jgi:hypothetical protein
MRTDMPQVAPVLLTRDDLLEILRRGPYLYQDPTPAVRSDLRLEIYRIAYQQILADANTECYLFAKTVDRRALHVPIFIIPLFIVRADCASEQLPLQSSLTNGILPQANPLGDFSRSFPDIDDLAKHLTKLSLEDLQIFFLGEKNRSGETIELTGVKVPTASVTIWGTVIIMAVTLYFLVVLRDFSSRLTPDDKAWNVPWIGISPDSAARSAFLTSMLIVPSTVGYLAWRGVHTSSYLTAQLAYAGMFLASIFLVAGIFRCWSRVVKIRSGPRRGGGDGGGRER